ncbi:MAG TPA: PQQ-dependent sugar dehydrogenase [Candidatus Limnocylindrales bacterium]|nr:PQQ-dependent sugar dehydrogenase [Candidatus Limnocylindrales bacterium]
MKRTVIATAVFSAALLASTSVRADEAADRCGAAKMKAAGRYGQALLFCNAAATRRDEAVDPLCTAKAADKLDGAIQKADDAGGCVTGMDAGAIEGAVSGDVDAVLAALAPDPNDDARQCAASKMKSAGKHYAALLACYSKGANGSEGPDPDCIVHSEDKLFAKYTKADDAGGCTATGDAGAIDDLATSGAHARVAELSPVCGDAITGPTQQCEPEDDGACPGQCSVQCICVVPPACGNGTAEYPEECDDGGAADGDGCSASCLLEDASALCDGVPSTSGTALDAVLVSADFNEPIYATAAPLDPLRLFVVERAGRIRIVNLADDTILSTPFLDIQDLTTTDGERGLLSMAFDPAYDTNRRFYVNYTNNAGDTTIARYEASIGDHNVADESTAKILLVITQPASNHNGGQIAFGADGYLYIGMGDGGGGGDPWENAQDDGELLGKILRMDVDVSTAPYYAVPTTNPHYSVGAPIELVWAKGTRNPWRFSFDRATGDLVIGDVGQDTREEIDFQSASSTGGENYGWDIFEGTMCYEPDPAPMCPSPPTGFTMPVLEYTHAAGCSITGGFVYRGCALPDLAGTYFYGDYCGNFIRTIELPGGVATNAQNRTSDIESAGASISSVISFGQDARGELYILEDNGRVYRIVPE